MTVIRSPFFKMFTFLIIAFTPVFGLGLALPRMLEKLECTDSCRVRHYLFALWLAAQFMYNFAATQWTHPGGTKKFRPNSDMEGQFIMHLGSPAVSTDTDSPAKGDSVMTVLY